jgi:aryl-alcohol dehydrogenase-like predicted oxidoreductase
MRKPTPMGRREFLKSTATGLGGFVYLRANLTRPPDAPDKFESTRLLGKTGIRVPIVSMGVMNTDNPHLVRAALDAGYVLLDTAQGYQRGTNEAMIGEILKGRPRNSFVIATKASLPKDQATGGYGPHATEEAYTKKIDTSLKSLGLDYVDIYYHHGTWTREATLFEPILAALEKAKKAGKTRCIGVSTHRNEPEVIQAATESKRYDVVLTAYNFRQQHAAEVQQAIAAAAGAGLGVVGMKSMGGNRGGAYASTQIDARACIKWVLQDPNVATVICGFTTFDQMTLDLTILKELTLTASEREQIRRAGLAPGLYCQGCGACVGQCVSQLPIPDLMRAHMYLHGYRNLVAAQDLVRSLDLPAETCADCASCPVICANRWSLPERVRDVVRLRNVPADLIV